METKHPASTQVFTKALGMSSPRSLFGFAGRRTTRRLRPTAGEVSIVLSLPACNTSNGGHSLIKQDGYPVHRERSLGATRRATAHSCATVTSRRQIFDQARWQLIEIGILPAHYKFRVIGAGQCRKPMVEPACGASVGGVANYGN